MTFDDFRRQFAAARRNHGGEKNGAVGEGLNVLAVEFSESTNALGMRVAAEYLEEEIDLAPTVILALEQSAGRGRQGRGWSSPRGKGVYASLIRGVGQGIMAELPLLVPVGVARGIEGVLGRGSCRLKWPNDLMVGGRKIGGVLIQTKMPGRSPADLAETPSEAARGVAVIGFGVNWDQNRGELPNDKTTSIRLESAEAEEMTSLGEVTWALVAAVEKELRHAGETGYAAESYRALSLHSPGDEVRCRVGGRELTGSFRGLDDHGFLLLETAAGEERISAGEVLEG